MKEKNAAIYVRVSTLDTLRNRAGTSFRRDKVKDFHQIKKGGREGPNVTRRIR
jgi:hypothetical protein